MVPAHDHDAIVPVDWGLLDAEAQHEAFPDSFPIPTFEERSTLRVGDRVKLVFVLDPVPEEGPNAERMWVEVTAVHAGPLFDGRLAGPPRVITTLPHRSEITFDARHVAGIALPVHEVAFAVDTTALITRRALRAAGPPGWAGFDPPVDPTDSGWTVSAGDEPDDYFTGDPDDRVKSLTLGELAERFPALVEAFQAGEGEWVYRPDHHRYVRIRGS